MREITREEAIRLFREQWADMQKALGDNPKGIERALFKKEWCKNHGYINVFFYCFLCEYKKQHGLRCSECLIDWRDNCVDGVNFNRSPISEILALNEREISK